MLKKFHLSTTIKYVKVSSLRSIYLCICVHKLLGDGIVFVVWLGHAHVPASAWLSTFMLCVVFVFVCVCVVFVFVCACVCVCWKLLSNQVH